MSNKEKNNVRQININTAGGEVHYIEQQINNHGLLITGGEQHIGNLVIGTQNQYSTAPSQPQPASTAQQSAPQNIKFRFINHDGCTAAQAAEADRALREVADKQPAEIADKFIELQHANLLIRDTDEAQRHHLLDFANRTEFAKEFVHFYGSKADYKNIIKAYDRKAEARKILH